MQKKEYKNIFKNYFIDARDFVKHTKNGVDALKYGKILIDIEPDSARQRKTKQLSLFEY